MCVSGRTSCRKCCTNFFGTGHYHNTGVSLPPLFFILPLLSLGVYIYFQYQLFTAHNLHYYYILYYCERSELSGVFIGTDFLYILCVFQAVRRAVNVLNVSTCI